MKPLDLQIVEMLQENGKLSYVDIGEKIGLSPSPVKERVNKLIKTGVLKQNSYLVNPTSVGLDLCAFVQVILPAPDAEENFINKVNNIDEIQECHCISGEYSYLLKVRVKNTLALEKLLANEIKSIKGVIRTNSTIVLTTYKETAKLKIE
jgi:Lrp/AsnC family leucine-responsive transcriptional regulator